MIKELKYLFYLTTIFFFIFLILKFYLSENNIKQFKKVMHIHQNELGIKFNNLPIIKNDTKDIIEYQDEVEKFKQKKNRKFWQLIK